MKTLPKHKIARSSRYQVMILHSNGVWRSWYTGKTVTDCQSWISEHITKHLTHPGLKNTQWGIYRIDSQTEFHLLERASNPAA